MVSASLLLQLTLMMSQKARACMRTTPSKPGVVVPPCGQCTWDSFYVTEPCPDTLKGCINIPATEALTHQPQPGGCREMTMNCPPGSMVYVDTKPVNPGDPDVPGISVQWEALQQMGLEKFICNDMAMWTVVLMNNNALVERMFCYRVACTACADIPISPPGDCTTGKTCEAPTPAPVYTPPMPGYGDMCRKVTIQCNLPNVLFTFTTGDTLAVPVTQLMDNTVTLECNLNSQWILNDQATTGIVASLICID